MDIKMQVEKATGEIAIYSVGEARWLHEDGVYDVTLYEKVFTDYLETAMENGIRRAELIFE